MMYGKVVVESPWPPLKRESNFPKKVLIVVLITAALGLVSTVFYIQDTQTAIRDDRLHRCIVRILIYYAEVPPDERSEKRFNSICPGVILEAK
jgi:hypothetical protein